MSVGIAKHFGFAVFLCFLAEFPCSHVWALYKWHHYTIGAQGLQPQLVDAYIWKATVCTSIYSLFVPLVAWLVLRLLVGNQGVWAAWVVGLFIGLVSSAILYHFLDRWFLLIAKPNLDLPGFLYNGALAGIFVADMYWRWRLTQLPVAEVQRSLAFQFLSAALITWAVLLKIGECLFVSVMQPGRRTFPLHFLAFLPVLLWTPSVCRYLRRRRPRNLAYSIVRSCAFGVLIPPLVSSVLFPVVGIVLYMGINLYPMLWGDLVFLSFYNFAEAKYYLLCLIPGFIWGIVVGLIRWRDLQLEGVVSVKNHA